MEVVLPAVVKLLDRLNTQYAQSSQEFELSTFAVDGGNLSFTHLPRTSAASLGVLSVGQKLSLFSPLLEGVP